MIFIFSSARSGSTWLAKAFDSHPDTLYLHEPDIVDRGDDLLPYWFDRDPRGWEEPARRYLTRLKANRNLRTVGTRPFFAKRYRSGLAHLLRSGLIYAGKGLEKAGFAGLAEDMAIADMARRGSSPKTVIKSVSALGRAEALLTCGEAIAAVLLLRHPCAYVNSYLTGNRLGVMRPHHPLGQLLETRAARRLNAAQAANEDDTIARLAWGWVVANSEAHAAIQRTGGTLMRYEDLALNPEAELRPLFAKLGLEWSQTTSRFLKSSQGGDGGSYYSLARDPTEAISKWKRQMEPAQIEQVRRIVCLDPVGQRYFTGQD